MISQETMAGHVESAIGKPDVIHRYSRIFDLTPDTFLVTICLHDSELQT